MPGFFDVRSDLPKAKGFQAQMMVTQIENAIRDSVKTEALTLYNKTTETWRRRPTFRVEDTPTGVRVLVGSVQVGDRRKPIWLYLDQGTAKRFAVMTKGFKAKTRPGYLVSYQGVGRMAYISKKPKKGIQARNWNEKIAERMRKSISQKVAHAVKANLFEL